MAHIGLLEDNCRIARLCATMLQYAGHQVTIYDHPRECLNALLPPSLSSEHKPQLSVIAVPVLPIDVLILDLNLPDINGKQVLQYLQAEPSTSALPLIFCTAAATAEINEVLRLAPHAGCLEKPFSFLALTTAITTALSVHTK